MTEMYQIDFSLYGKVNQALYANHGKLPEDFILNRKNYADGIVISEGCLDKMLFRHVPQQDAQPYETVLEESFSDCTKASDDSEKLFSQNSIRYVLIKDEINNWIRDHHDQMQRTEVISFLKRRIRETAEVEELKFLLDCCGELESYDAELQKMIVELAQSGETASFCYPAIHKFPNANEVIYGIARKTDHQAKAEAIYALEVDNNDKKKWLIYHGMPGYLGWYSTGAVIARKCDFLLMLADPDLTIKDRDQIGWITSTFLEEGRAFELEKLHDWQKLCIKYIQLVRKKPTVKGIQAISHEYDCIEKYQERTTESLTDLMNECEEALRDENILSFTKNRKDLT